MEKSDNDPEFFLIKLKNILYEMMHDLRRSQNIHMIQYMSREGMQSWKDAFEESFGKQRALLFAGPADTVTGPLLSIPPVATNVEPRLINAYYEVRRTRSLMAYLKCRDQTTLEKIRQEVKKYKKKNNNQIPDDQDPFWLDYDTANIPWLEYAKTIDACDTESEDETKCPRFRSRDANRQTCLSVGCIRQQNSPWEGNWGKHCKECAMKLSKLDVEN